MPEADARVAFLVAGVQKAGTTALFDYLREVPSLHLPDAKEAHFFDDEEGVDWNAPDYRRYHRMFLADGRLRGEATPIYLYWPGALERIQRYNPAMRLILLFRDPVERAFSHWKMEYARGKETEPFAWCIREGRARMATASPTPGFHRVYSYVERGFYGRQLARALLYFPREQILLLRSRELADEPEDTIRRVCAFLGVDPPAGPIRSRRVREAAARDYPSTVSSRDEALLWSAYESEMLRFATLAGGGERWRFGPLKS